MNIAVQHGIVAFGQSGIYFCRCGLICVDEVVCCLCGFIYCSRQLLL